MDLHIASPERIPVSIVHAVLNAGGVKCFLDERSVLRDELLGLPIAKPDSEGLVCLSDVEMHFELLEV